MLLRGALAPAREQALAKARRRHSCAWAPARARTRRRMRWQVHGRVKVGGDLVEPRGIKLGNNMLLPVYQCHGDGRWRSRGDGSRNGSGDRRGVFPQGQFKLVPKRLMFLRLRLDVFLRKLED